MIGWYIALGGAAAGMVQAGLLARVARNGPDPLSFLVRLVLVGTVLFLAARTGHLAAGAAAWSAALIAAGVRAHRKLR